MSDLTNVGEVMRWLAAGGAFIVVNWFASWFLETFNFWAKLAAKVKSLIILVFAIVVGCLATFYMAQPPEVVAPYNPYLVVVFLTISAWLALQVAHRNDSRAQ